MRCDHPLIVHHGRPFRRSKGLSEMASFSFSLFPIIASCVRGMALPSAREAPHPSLRTLLFCPCLLFNQYITSHTSHCSSSSSSSFSCLTMSQSAAHCGRHYSIHDSMIGTNTVSLSSMHAAIKMSPLDTLDNKHVNQDYVQSLVIKEGHLPPPETSRSASPSHIFIHPCHVLYFLCVMSTSIQCSLI